MLGSKLEIEVWNRNLFSRAAQPARKSERNRAQVTYAISLSSEAIMKSNTPLIKITVWLSISAAFILLLILYSGAISKSENRATTNWFGHVQFHGAHDEAFSRGEEVAMGERKEFLVEPNGKFLLDCGGADVEITTWDSNKVQIIWTNLKSETPPERFHVKAVQEGNTVTVVGKYHAGFLFSWDNDPIQFTVKLPKHFHPSVDVSGGDVSVADINGTVNVETSGGDITVKNIFGETKLETSGGDIVADQIEGAVNVETSGGDIQLQGIKGNVRCETSGGDIVAFVLDESPSLFCETSGGDITIYLAENAKANLRASTSGGSVSLRLKNQFNGNLEDHEIAGTINGGGGKISAETSGGDIRFLNR